MRVGTGVCGRNKSFVSRPQYIYQVCFILIKVEKKNNETDLHETFKSVSVALRYDSLELRFPSIKARATTGPCL